MAETVEPSTSSLADRINRLFDVMRKPSDPPLSNAAAAEAITAATGVSISPAYLWQLRSGLKQNPTITHLQAIAQYFGVAPSYLVDPEPSQHMESQLRLLQAFRDAGVRDLAMRASGITPAALSQLSAMVNHVRELENLPPVPSETTDKDPS